MYPFVVAVPLQRSLPSTARKCDCPLARLFIRARQDNVWEEQWGEVAGERREATKNGRRETRELHWSSFHSTGPTASNRSNNKENTKHWGMTVL